MRGDFLAAPGGGDYAGVIGLRCGVLFASAGGASESGGALLRRNLIMPGKILCAL